MSLRLLPVGLTYLGDGVSANRFDGVKLMRTLGGKKVMFVGDSLTLNQYLSFLCLLHAAVPNATLSFSSDNRSLSAVTFEVSSSPSSCGTYHIIPIINDG